MLTGYIHRLRTVELPAETTREETNALKEGLRPAAARRLSTLALMLNHVAREHLQSPVPRLYYLSNYSETRALEDYLDSFPEPSPKCFSTSIHPGGIDQLLIAYGQPVSELFPLGGRAEGLASALTLALASDCPSLFIGGEERGTWLNNYGAASPRQFAFAFQMSQEASGADAQVRWQPGDGDPSLPQPDLLEWFDHLVRRNDYAFGHRIAGRFSVRWTDS